MSNTHVITVASGSTDTFPIPFPYIAPANVEVRLDGVLQTLGVDFTIVGSDVVFSGGNVAADTAVQRRRVTSTTAIVTFSAGSLDEDDLNNGDLQSRYLAEEAKDQAEYVESLVVDIDTDAILAAQAQVEADAAQVAADKITVAADKATVAADKATVAADKATVAADKATVTADTATVGADKLIVEGYRDEVEADRVDVQADKVIAAAAADAATAAQVAAEAALASTLTAYDNFDDRYLGTFSADPTLDNDGNALLAGSLYYFDGNGTPANAGIKVYTGSAWVVAYVSGGGFLAAANNLSDVNSPASARTNLDVYSTTETLALPFGRTAKATLVDADTLSITDSAASDVWKKITWANVKTALNALYQPLLATLTSWGAITRASGFDTFVATPSSANLKSLVTDETGSGGALVFANGPSLSGPTLVDPIITGTIKQDVYTITDGAGFTIDPTNGAVQRITLGASRTPVAANWEDGESVTLFIADGTAYAITWSTIGVVWKNGVAPTLATSGYTEVNITKENSVYRGVHVGDFAS